MNAAVPNVHRVILYPQSYFTRDSTHIVCYSKSNLAENFAQFMNAHIPSCPVHPEDVPGENEAATDTSDEPTIHVTDDRLKNANIYPEDVALWEKHCAGTLA